jgi:hypothetical protein
MFVSAFTRATAGWREAAVGVGWVFPQHIKPSPKPFDVCYEHIGLRSQQFARGAHVLNLAGVRHDFIWHHR